MNTPRRFLLMIVAAAFGFAILTLATFSGEIARADDEAEHADEVEATEVVDNCVTCHTEEDMLPEHFLAADVHMKAGLSCAGCHGGDPGKDDQEEAMSPKAGFRGVPDKKDIPHFCGRCHSDIEFMRKYQPRIETDQETQYYASVHGQRLKMGDKKVADCTSCHSAHSILPASDTRSSVHALNVPATCGHCHGDADYMAGYNIPTDQLAKFKKSVHGIALLDNQDTGAPACNDCHGNHGATPPGVTSIAQVCGQCHVNNMQYFTESRMGQAFHEEGYHGCEECHGNHGVAKTSDKMVGTSDDAVCINCHDPGDKGYETAGLIHASLDTLATVYEEAEARQAEVRKIGMDDVDIGFLLQEAHQSLIKSRTLVHTFDAEKVAASTTVGTVKAREAIEMANAQVKDHEVRRRGFGMATLFTTILAIALFFWIRQIESGA